MADKTASQILPSEASGTVSSSTAHSDNEFSTNASSSLPSHDLESQSAPGPADAEDGPRTSDKTDLNRSDSSSNNNSDYRHGTIALSSPSKWRWPGAKELQSIIGGNKRTPFPSPPSALPPESSSTVELSSGPPPSASAIPMEGSGRASEPVADVRVVIEDVQSSAESKSEGGQQTIDNVPFPTGVGVGVGVGAPERAQPGNSNPTRPAIRGERELLVVKAASGGGKKRKVSSVVDNYSYADPSHDLETGLPNKVITGGAISIVGGISQRHQDEEDDEEEPVCRVCHTNTSTSSKNADVIDLGCACKLDLGRAHRECAETWFQLKGNKKCEICGEVAQNVRLPVAAMSDSPGQSTDSTITLVPEHRSSTACWQNRPIRNFLLVFLVAAFLVPWLFRFACYS